MGTNRSLTGVNVGQTFFKRIGILSDIDGESDGERESDREIMECFIPPKYLLCVVRLIRFKKRKCMSYLELSELKQNLELSF